jgi:hypothetical protein
LRRAYAEADAMIGDYWGAKKANSRRELLGVVYAEFQKLGVP